MSECPDVLNTCYACNGSGVVEDFDGDSPCSRCDGAGHLHRERPRGRDTSPELTEVRTVLSRAESALDRLAYVQWQQRAGSTFYPTLDPDHDRMRDALAAVVEQLDEWRRTGRPKQ